MNTLLDLSELNYRIGQLFMVGIPGTSLDENTKLLMRDYNISGIILFSRNIEDPVQLARLCQDIQDTAFKYHGIPPFLAVDQEGGRVARLVEPFTIFQGNESIGMDEDPVERAREFGIITAREMKIVGLNMNLAPVLDVPKGKTEKHLKGRTFSEDHKAVSLLGRIVIKHLQENGVMAVAKHFPGLGRTGIDPHSSLPKIESDVREIDEINMPPFEVAIKEGVSAIMTSHAVYPALDPERSATLSPYILNSLLRNKMGFNGLIITDDLEMGAIAKEWGVDKGALASLEAGADMLLICKDQKNLLDSIQLIREKILRKEISEERLDESNNRIKEAKSKYIHGKDKISIKEIKRYFKM